MEVVDRQSSPVYEEKTLDETTVFFSENGSVSKKRRRKSLGRRVSFAEAPKLHIFPRDDEYETPTRATNGTGSPHREGGSRRSPRLAAKVVDADKENQVFASNPALQRGRRRGGSKVLAARGGESPALKPNNWLDARDPPSQAGNRDDEENTGPVDLRHLSFNQMETEMDEENITLDSTTFALKSLQQIRSGELAAVVQLDKNRSAAVSTDDDGFPDGADVLQDILENDMSFTMNRPLLRRKPVRESITGFESMGSDTSMSITMQVSTGHKRPCIVVGGDSINVRMEEDSMAVSPQKIPLTRKSTLPGSRDDNSAVVLNSHDMQNGPTPVLRTQNVRALLLERFGDLSDDTSPEQQNSQYIKVPRADDLRAQSEENVGNDGDDINVRVEDDSMSLSFEKIPPTRKFKLPGSRDDNSAVVLSPYDVPNGPASVRAQDVCALPEKSCGDPDDTRPDQGDCQGVFKSPLQGIEIPRAEDLQAELQENFGNGGDDINVRVEEDSTSLSFEKIPPTRKFKLPGSRDDNSAVVLSPYDVPNGPASIRAQDVRALPEESCGDLDDTRPDQGDSQGVFKSPLQGIEIPRAEDLQTGLRENFGNGGDDINVRVEDDSMSLSFEKIPPTRKFKLPGNRDENSAAVLSSHDVQNSPAPVTRAQDVRALLEGRYGNLGADSCPEQGNSRDALKSPLQGIKIRRPEGLRVQLEGNPGNEGDDINVQVDDNSMSLSPEKIPPRKSILRDSRADNSEVVLSSHDAQNGPAPVACAQNVRALLDERYGDLGDDSSPEQRNSQVKLKSPLREIKVPRAKDLRAPLEEKFGDDGDRLRLTLRGIELPGAEELRGQSDERIGVDLSENRNLTTGSEETAEMSVSSPTCVASRDIEDRTITRGIPSFRQLIRQEEDERSSFTAHEDRTITMGIPSFRNFIRKEQEERSSFVAHEDPTITMGIPSFRDLIRKEEDDRSSFVAYEDRTITMGIPSFRDLIRKEEEDEEKMAEEGLVFDTKHKERETLNLTEDAEMMLMEEEFTGLDSRVTLNMDESPGPNFAKCRARETLNSTEDAMSTEEQFTGVDSRATNNNEELPAPNFAKYRAMETPNPTEDSEMILKEEFTGIVSRAPASNEESPGPNFDIPAMQKTKFERGSPSVDGKESDNDVISSRKNGYAAVGKGSRAEDSHSFPVLESVTAQDMKSLDSTPVRPSSRSMWMTPPSSVIAARAEDECSSEGEDDIYDATALITERIREDGEASISGTKVLEEEKDVPHFTIKSDDKTALIAERVHEDGEERISVTKMSVEEFLQHTGVHFSLGLQRSREVLKDPSLAETYHVRSLSESFNFLCLVKPKLKFMQNACEELDDVVDLKETAVEQLEQRLTASNPAIVSYFQKAPEEEKQRIKKELERIQRSYRSAQKNRLQLQLQQRVEKEYNSSLLDMKKMMMHYVDFTKEQRNIVAENIHRRLPRLQASHSSRDAKQECISTSYSKLSTVKHLHTTIELEMIKLLKDRLERLKSSGKLKSAKLTQKQQATEEALRGLKQKVEQAKNNLSGLRNQVVDNVCTGKNNLQKEDVALSPYLHVQKMRSKVCLLQRLQDGFQVKSAGRENQDIVVELSYRSLVKRRYVVRKAGTAVRVLRSSWFLEPEKIEEVFPKMTAVAVFSFALRTSDISKATAKNPTAWTQMLFRFSTSEALRFTLSSNQPDSIPEPTDLGESMQVTRFLVGNLMELMEEIRNCQTVVSASSGGGILAETRFRDAPGGHLQLELKFIDYLSSIKFFIYLDMSCLPMNGYPLGYLPAKVEITDCAPRFRHRFNRETLEHLLSLVKPGYQKLVRTYAAVGSFLASLRRGVTT